MTENEIKSLKVGSRIEDLGGDVLEVVAIDEDRIMHQLKWVMEDGSLSDGTLFAVPSHMKWDKLISY